MPKFQAFIFDNKKMLFNDYWLDSVNFDIYDRISYEFMFQPMIKYIVEKGNSGIR